MAELTADVEEPQAEGQVSEAEVAEINPESQSENPTDENGSSSIPPDEQEASLSEAEGQDNPSEPSENPDETSDSHGGDEEPDEENQEENESTPRAEEENPEEVESHSGVDESERFAEFGDEEDSTADSEFRRAFDSVKSEYERLKNESGNLVRRLLEEFQNLGFDDSSSFPSTDSPDKYQAALEAYEAKKNLYEETKKKYEREQQLLDQAMIESNRSIEDKVKEFSEKRERIAKHSIMARTNKSMPMSLLNEKNTSLKTKEDSLTVARVKYIKTKNNHRQAEDDLNQQDQLSDGLHLIDFEQLKIENQTLNEKKSEKEQELDRIKGKITENAHALTHVREKLNFVIKQREELEVKLQEIDKSYAQSRSVLANSRNKRDKVRDDNSNLKKSSGLIGMTDLLYDFENRSNELELMQDRVAELKRKYQDLMSIQHELEAKIAQRQPLDQTLLKMNR